MMSTDRKAIKRRASPIGHLKNEHRLRRNHLKGEIGDAINAVMAAAGYNLRWLMRWLACFCALLGAVVAFVDAADSVEMAPSSV